MKKYTKQDAIHRVLDARTGSLAPDHITLEYLEVLQINIQNWLDTIIDDKNQFIINKGKEE